MRASVAEQQRRLKTIATDQTLRGAPIRGSTILANIGWIEGTARERKSAGV
jgi:hypothetical protein